MSNTKNPYKSRPFGVSVLIFLQIFLGLNGLFGGGAFILAPDGHLIKMPFSHLKNTPFSSFRIPGLLLFVFLGFYPLLVAYCLSRKPAWRWPDALNPFRRIHWSWAASLSVGFTAVIWIIVQIQWIPVGFLHLFILCWGILIILFTLFPNVRRYYLNKA